jgi:hypothetical protein
MRSIHARLIIGLVILCATLALAQTRTRRPSGPRPPVPGSPSQDQESSEPTRLQVEFFQVNCRGDDLVKISVDKLGNKPSAEEVVEKLRAFGVAGLKVRTDNVIDLSRSSSLNEGGKVPVQSGVNVGPNGKITPSVTYNDIGGSIRIQGSWDEERKPDTAHVSCSIQLSSIGNSAIEQPDGAHLPEFRLFKVEQEMDLESGTPILLMSNSQPAPSVSTKPASEESQCTVTVVRITAWKLWKTPAREKE